MSYGAGRACVSVSRAVIAGVTCVVMLALVTAAVAAAQSSGYSCGTASRPCVAPGCVCPSGAAPGGLARESTPQFVVLSFDDAVTPAVRAKPYLSPVRTTAVLLMHEILTSLPLSPPCARGGGVAARVPL